MELNCDLIEFRVVLVDPRSRQILAFRTDTGLRLPRISTSRGTRAVPHLRHQLQSEFGLTVIVLDYFYDGSQGSICAVAELLDGEQPHALEPARTDDLPLEELSQEEQARLLRILTGGDPNPFTRIGGMYEVNAWVEATTGQQLMSGTAVKQYNAGGGFALIQLPMDSGQSFWLKATGQPNIHERPLTYLLSYLCPNELPTFVAERPEWNAWLMTDAGLATTTLPTDLHTRIHMFELAVRCLTNIQSRTAGTESSLLAAGAFDQRLHVLGAHADALFEHVAEAMTFQTSTKVARIEPRRLGELRKILEEVCNRAEALRVPATIVHGDMNLGNLIFDEDRCFFLDWSEGYLGFPLATFQHLLLLNNVEPTTIQTSTNAKLKDLYCAAWGEVCDPTHVEKSLVFMPFLAATSALYGRGDWIGSDMRDTPHRYAYIRNLARHLNEAALELQSMNAVSV